MRAQLVKRQIQTLNGVIESADQELQKNSGRGVAAIVETLDALAELLANFIKRHGVPLPNRQNAGRAGENVDLANIARRVRHPGHHAQRVAADIHPAGLFEP